MAAKFKETFGVESILVESSGGVFDVDLDGALVYSKHETGAFPDEARLVAELQAKG